MTRQRPALLWDDLDLSSTLNCGHHRCFVPSLSESSVGYIISRIEEGTYTGMVNEAKLAHKMQESYKCKTFHISDEMPMNVTLPTEIASKVNAQVRNQLRQYQFPDSFIDGNKTLESYYNEPNVIVQKMKAADNTSILAHCADNGFTKTQIPTFLSHVKDDIEFGANLARDRYLMFVMLSEEPEIATDLQVMLSSNGEIYFIDFGGHSAWTEKDKHLLTLRQKEELCGESFDMILDAIRNRDKVEDGTWKWRGRRYQRHVSRLVDSWSRVILLISFKIIIYP